MGPQMNGQWGELPHPFHVLGGIQTNKQINRWVDGAADEENETGDSGLPEEVMLLQKGDAEEDGRAGRRAFQQVEGWGEQWRQDQTWGREADGRPEATRGRKAGLPGLRFY